MSAPFKTCVGVVALVLTLGGNAAAQKSAAEIADEKALAAALAKVAEIRSRMAKRAAPQEGMARSQQGAFRRAATRSGHIVEEPAAPEPKNDNCKSPRLFIRADSIDNLLYNDAVPVSEAVGASFTYKRDFVTDEKGLAVAGRLSYVVARDLCPDTPPGIAPFVSGWAVAPWVSGYGTYTWPQSPGEKSKLSTGVDMQFEISRGPFAGFPARQVFTIAPFHQTDFRGLADISGAKLFWDLYDLRYHLGGYVGGSPYLGWYLQLRGEADIRSVNETGLTGLAETRYAWVGGTARLHVHLLPFAPDIPDIIRNRFAIVASASYFQDLTSGVDVNKYSALLKYKLDPAGYSSIGFEYARGTDKDTLVFANEYWVKLLVTY
jgi:hypothetical protein